MPIREVSFNLWAVLLGIVLLFGSVFSILYADQTKVKDKQQEINQRVTKLEAQICYIVEGIKEIKDSQKDVLRTLEDHKKRTER